MGCGTHAVLQKKQDDGTWLTIDTDVLQLPSSVARQFNDESQAFRTNGFPAGFSLNESFEHDGYWMGDHSYGYFTVKEFLAYETETYDKVSFERTDEGYMINVDFRGEQWDEVVVELQRGLSWMYNWEEENYRIVMGYDS